MIVHCDVQCYCETSHFNPHDASILAMAQYNKSHTQD